MYLGIDPGLSGGIAIIASWGIIAEPMPVVKLNKGKDLDVSELYRILEPYSPKYAVIEKVHAMPKQGVSSTFKFGKNYGQILGILTSLKIPYEEVRPQKWKKIFGLKGQKTSSIQKAKQLFPDVNLLPTERSKKDSDGMAEALLIAEYARRTHERS